MLLPLPLTFPLPPSSPYVRWGWERVASSQLLCIACASGCDVTEVVIEAGHVLRSRGTYDRAARLLRVKAESRCGLSLIIFWSITLNKQATFLGEGKKKKKYPPRHLHPQPQPQPQPNLYLFFLSPRPHPPSQHFTDPQSKSCSHFNCEWVGGSRALRDPF